MNRIDRKAGTAVAVVALLVVTLATPLQAGGTRSSRGGTSVSSGGGSRGSGSAGATRSSGSSSAGNTRSASGSGRVGVAAGRASYGHGGHHGGYYGGHGYGYSHGYYPYHGSYWYWGWPAYYSRAWSGPYYPYPVLATQVEGSRAPIALQTSVRPKKATLIVDGTPMGQARDYNGKWDVLHLHPGAHLVEFNYKGYQTLRLYLETEPGRFYVIHQDLQKGEGLDSRSTERTELPPAETTSDPGQRGVSPRQPRNNRGDDHPPQSALRTGLLRIEVEPRDAAIYLDGEFLAQAGELARLHGALPVAEGSHRVEAVRPGYESNEVKVEVSAGTDAVKVVLRLTRSGG